MSVKQLIFSFKKTIRTISLIDKITALLFILILIGSIFFFLRKKEYIFITLAITTSYELTYTGYGNPPEWFIANVKPGLEEKDLLGRKQIQITNVYRYESNGSNINPDLYVTLKIQGVYDKKNGRYTYDGVPLLIGSNQKFSIKNIQIAGILRSVSKEYVVPITKSYLLKGFLDPENNDFPKNKSIIDSIKSNGIPKILSSKLYPNLTTVDTNGNTTVMIKTISKEPAFYKIPNNGQFSYIGDPEREKVEMEIIISASMIDGKPFYKQEFPLTINNNIELVFPQEKVVFTITDLQPLE